MWAYVDMRTVMYGILLFCINSPDLTMYIRFRFDSNEISLGFDLESNALGCHNKIKTLKIVKWLYLYLKHNTKFSIGYRIRLYRFLIIAILSTLVMNSILSGAKVSYGIIFYHIFYESWRPIRLGFICQKPCLNQFTIVTIIDTLNKCVMCNCQLNILRYMHQFIW